MRNRRGAFTLAFLCACSGKVIDVGSNQGGAAGSTPGNGGGGAAGATSGVGGSGVGGYEAGGSSAGSYAGDGIGAAGSSAGNFGGSGGVGAGGSGNAGSVGTGGMAIPPWPTDSDCQSGPQLPIVGTWVGYIENYMFSSGSDAVRVAITAANDAHLCGKVTFGEGTPPLPPTDPNIGYPPSLVAATTSSGAAGGSNYEGASEAYPLTILDGQSSTARVQFQVNMKELWKTWCELQTSYFWADSYWCVQSGGWGTSGGACTFSNGDAVDCSKIQLCTSGGVCTCTANGCTVTPQGDVSFDLHVQSANQLTGSATLSGLHNVYLDRTP